jgi:preprotein translocase subunit SecY
MLGQPNVTYQEITFAMLEKLRICWTIPELRKKILLTLGLLAVYRIGWQITLPFVDQGQIAQFAQNMEGGTIGTFLDKVSLFSGSQLSQATIFGLGIMPYISASIILQLMGTVYAPLEALKKEGEAGRKKINEYTRYLTVVLCVIQSFLYLRFMLMAGGMEGNLIADEFELGYGGLPLSWQLTGVLIMTCGSVFLMWLGEQIDEYGIGNGISLLIMAGIVAMMPGALINQLKNSSFGLTGLSNSTIGLEKIILLALMFIGVVVGVVFITLGQRRIPTQSAKHVRGRRVYGGTRQYMPLRVNQAGVMPIIFAQSLLMIPPLIFAAVAGTRENWFQDLMGGLGNVLQDPTSMVYSLVYIAMIYFFCYFWTAITFNTKEISDNMKDNGTFIPGYRPGRRTEDYLENVIERITYVGAGFLALIAVVPTIISSLMGVDYMVASFYGGTGLLIAVSVAFDLVQKIDSHLVMRNYSGLLE